MSLPSLAFIGVHSRPFAVELNCFFYLRSANFALRSSIFQFAFDQSTLLAFKLLDIQIEKHGFDPVTSPPFPTVVSRRCRNQTGGTPWRPSAPIVRPPHQPLRPQVQLALRTFPHWRRLMAPPEISNHH